MRAKPPASCGVSSSREDWREMIEVADLLRLADDGVAEFVRHTARHGRKTMIKEQDGLLLVSGSHSAPGPYRNMAMRQSSGIAAETVVDRADMFFAEGERGYVLWVRDHADEDLLSLAAERRWNPLEENGLLELVMHEPPELREAPPG